MNEVDLLIIMPGIPILWFISKLGHAYYEYKCEIAEATKEQKKEQLIENLRWYEEKHDLPRGEIYNGIFS